MSLKKGNRSARLNTGSMIRAKAKEKQFTMAALARLTGRKNSTVTTLLKKTSMQAYILWELSLALKHNFFADLAQQLNEAAGAGALENSEAPAKTKIEALEKENQQLREERDMMRKVVEVLGKVG
jgi:hypothetical protein